MLCSALTARRERDVRVMRAIALESVVELLTRLRADRHRRRRRIVLLTGGTQHPSATDYAAVQRPLELSTDALVVARSRVDGVYDNDLKTHPDAQRLHHPKYRHCC